MLLEREVSSISDLYDVSLNLQLVAQNEAEDVLNTLNDTVTTLKENIMSINDVGDPFAELMDATTELYNNINDANDAIKSLKRTITSFGRNDPFAPLRESLSTLNTDIDEVNTSIGELKSNIQSFSQTNPYESVDEDTTLFKSDIDLANEAFSKLKEAISSFSPKDPYTSVQEDTTQFSDDVTSTTSVWRNLIRVISESTITTNPFEGIQTELGSTISQLREALSLMRQMDSQSVGGGSYGSGGGSGGSNSPTYVPSNPGSGSGNRKRRVTNAPKTSLHSQPRSVNGQYDYGSWLQGLNVKDIPAELLPTYENAVNDWIGWGSSDASSINEGAPELFYNDVQAYLAQQNPQEQPKPTPSPNKNGHGSPFSSFGHGLLTTGMNSMMLFYGLQSLAQGASNFQYIQEMMMLGQGKSSNPANYSAANVDEAMRAYGMLASSGMSGQTGVTFLSGLNNNLKNMFTMVGHEGYSKEARILQNAGFSLSDISGSPWMTLQNLQKGYQTLMNNGEVSQASQYLGITGTTQLAPLFSNWGTAQGAFSNFSLGMNGSQLNASVKSSVDLNATLAKLGISFDEFAVKVIPILKTITSGLQSLADVLSGKGGIMGELKSAQSALSNPFDLLLGAYGVSKGVKLGRSTLGSLGKLFGSTGETEIAESAIGGPEVMLPTMIMVAMQSALENIIPNPNKNHHPGSFGLLTMGPKALPEIIKWFDNLGKNAQPGLSHLATTVKTSTGGLSKDAQPGLDMLSVNITKHSGRLSKDAQPGLDGMSTAVKKSAEGLSKHVQPGLDSMSATVKKSTDGLTKQVQPGMDSFSSQFHTWISNLTSKATSILNSINLGMQSQQESVEQFVYKNTPFGLGKKIVSGTQLAEQEFTTQLQQGGSKSGIVVHHDHSGKLQIEITSKGVTAAEKQHAEQVAKSVISALKLTGNFDLSY